jgi:hypothetical protein
MACLPLSGDYMNNFINENWRLVWEEKGLLLYNAFGSIAHTIFSEAVKTVPYKDIFDDVE